MRTIDEMKCESLWRLRYYRVRGTTKRIEKASGNEGWLNKTPTGASAIRSARVVTTILGTA